MERNARLLFFGLGVALLMMAGIAIPILSSNRPAPDPDIFSPTAALNPDILHRTQAAAQSQVAAVQAASSTPSPYSEFTPGAELTQFAQQQQGNVQVGSLTPSPTPLLPPINNANTQCGWQWATQINTDLSVEIRQRLLDAGGMGTIEVRAESFGENCINNDGSVRYFAVMETDFRIFVWLDDVPVDDLAAVQEIFSPLARTILAVLADYPPDETPGPQPGKIGIEFPARIPHLHYTYWVWVDYDAAMAALNEDLFGAALFDALGGLRYQGQIMLT